MGAAGARALPRPRRARLALAGGLTLLALLAAVLAQALVGGRSGPATPAPAARPFDGTLAGAPLQRARCRNWHAASATQRGQAVRALSATLGGASTSGGVGTTLPDTEVTALFDRVCSTPQTANFVLYLIYARAAAFSRRGPTPIVPQT